MNTLQAKTSSSLVPSKKPRTTTPAVKNSAVPAAGGKSEASDLPAGKLAYNISELCKATGLGQTKIFEEIKKRRLISVWVAGRRLILREDAEAWLRAGREDDDGEPP
ncbi:MAG: hypothetical protein RLZ98_3195 [Pseudomonadota bacterium]